MEHLPGRDKPESANPEGAHVRSAAALVAAVVSGDRTAEAELVEKYRPGLTYVLGRKIADQAVVDDLSQESLLIVIVRLRSRGLEQPEKLGAFVLGVARRLAKAHRRREARYANVPEVFDRAEDGSLSPPERAARSQEAKIVRDAIARLPVPRDRYVLTQRYLVDQDKSLLCAALGLDPQHFDRVLHRARTRLKKEVEILRSYADNGGAVIGKPA